jgi:hypothetical protein
MQAPTLEEIVVRIVAAKHWFPQAFTFTDRSGGPQAKSRRPFSVMGWKPWRLLRDVGAVEHTAEHPIARAVAAEAASEPGPSPRRPSRRYRCTIPTRRISAAFARRAGGGR